MSEKIKYEILAVVILILAIGLLVAQYMNSIEKIGIKPLLNMNLMVVSAMWMV